MLIFLPSRGFCRNGISSLCFDLWGGIPGLWQYPVPIHHALPIQAIFRLDTCYWNGVHQNTCLTYYSSSLSSIWMKPAGLGVIGLTVYPYCHAWVCPLKTIFSHMGHLRSLEIRTILLQNGHCIMSGLLISSFFKYFVDQNAFFFFGQKS